LAGIPYIVGAHWYCFADEPAHGRPTARDDYNFGLVDNENQPYEQLLTAMSRVHSQVNSVHGASIAPGKLSSNAVVELPAANKAPLEGIGNWDKRGRIPPRCDSTYAADLLACWDSNYVYLAALGLRYVDEQLYAVDMPTEAERMRFLVEPSGVGRPLSIHFGLLAEVNFAGGRVDCRIRGEGPRYVLLAAIPAAIFGKRSLSAGDKIEFRASLHDPRDDATIRWAANLRMD
jgi:hypothetical protein